ncbi:hypothetical protein NM688_g6604 [Phlebia brevispora]|uniref:Uncharacterized protein n=1 Tax=Phlebia brevispora TaxID=194682 RepID=A0ACC1SE50_9APHY|nr:hypothetical protein NM688_g6604 [Phlebia brevispora]
MPRSIRTPITNTTGTPRTLRHLPYALIGLLRRRVVIMTLMAGVNDLKSLRNILTSSIDSIIDVCEKQGEDFPRIEVPADPSELTQDGIRSDPQVRGAILLGVSAAAQLIATLQPPQDYLTMCSARYTVSGCICAAERLHLAETIRKAGSQGIHVDEIAKHNGAHPGKLARVLRYLTTNYIFQETAPNVFAHNIVSSLLDTGKDIDEIKRDPIAKFDNTNGLAAWASMYTDDCMKSCSYLDVALTDPTSAHSEEFNEASIQLAFGFKEPLWEWYERPENLLRLRRFGVAMHGAEKLQPPEAVLTTYDWDSVPIGATFVDVGSGIGTVDIAIAKMRPDLKIVLEDRPQVIAQAKEHCYNLAPELVASEKIQFIGADFWEPQPDLVRGADIFFLRHICHNYSDKYATKLLKHLRDAAKPTTKLVVMDSVMQHACRSPQRSSEEHESELVGYKPHVAPEPLLANFGLANVLAYDLDLVMLNNLNANERTIGEWRELFAASGWKLTAVHENSMNRMFWPAIIAEVA